jgi:hypothetical protein
MAVLALPILVLASALPDASGLDVTGEPDVAPASIAHAAELDALCRALEPAERLRTTGDAVDRGVAEDEHERARDVAAAGRYEVLVPAGKLAFARYRRDERRLALRDALLPLAWGSRLFEAMEGGLPVEVAPEAARRILAAQRKGDLELRLTFDLPDEASCSRGWPRTLPVEPVAWIWRSGAEELARGGAAADRPLVPVTGGALPRVAVGEPLDGPAEARGVVEARAPALSACYGEALKRAPSLDGVLVADLAPGRGTPAIAADSVGDAPLADCVRKALAGTAALRAFVPIRFDLELPTPAEQGSAGAPSSPAVGR